MNNKKKNKKNHENFLAIGGKRFHYLWLRDNCSCSKCRDTHSFQRIYDLSNQISRPEPLSVEEKDGYLKIIWNEEPTHQSVFSRSWLLSNSYDPQPNSINEPTILWDKAYLEENPPQLYPAIADRYKDWMSQLFKLGFIILKSGDLADFQALLLSIGPIYDTEYGEGSAVKVEPNSKDLAYSGGYALSPHTDGSYRHDGRLIQFLYCIENQAVGGNSLIVDGFRVGEDFRQHHPHDFDILVKTPVPFRQFDRQSEYFFYHTSPMIQLNETGEISDIYFCHKNLNVHLPFEKVERFYEAYLKFASYLKNPAYQYQFQLNSGDCLIVENFRVLHGRTQYDPTSGGRHLEVGYMNWHYWIGRYLFDRAKYLYQGE